jgi:cell division protein FtsN
MDEGDDQAACGALRNARLAVTPNDVELTIQIDYLLGQCAIPVIPPDSTRAPPSSGTQPAGRTFSIQVAAFSARGEANTLVTQLGNRGFDARVVGTRSPYRVRIGRYTTRAAAVSDLPRIRAAGLSAAFVVEAEPG